MQRLRLAEPADAVICALDSLNYLMRPDDCRKTFRRVIRRAEAWRAVRVRYQHARKAARLDGQVFLDETDDTYCVWRTEFDAKKAAVLLWHGHFPAERRFGTRSFEEHIEYAYEPDELPAGSKAELHTSGNMATACCAHQSRMSSVFIFRKEGLTMKDELVRAMTKDGFVNAVAVTTTGIVERRGRSINTSDRNGGTSAGF